MRVGIDNLKNRHEADAVTRSMNDPVVKTATVITGMLLELESMAQRRAVISVVVLLIGANGTTPEIADLRLHDGGASAE